MQRTAPTGSARPRGGRHLLLVVCLAVGVWPLPSWYCRRGAARWGGPIGDVHRAQAEVVRRWVERPLSRASFSTGSDRFDREWSFGGYMMAGMGFGLLIQAVHPSRGDPLDEGWSAGRCPPAGRRCCASSCR